MHAERVAHSRAPTAKIDKSTPRPLRMTEVYLNPLKPRITGQFFSHLPEPFILHSRKFRSPPSTLNTFYQIPMAYLNDASFYSTSFTFGELDAYPILNLTAATEEVNIETSDTFTNGWNVGRQTGYMVDEPTSLGAEASFGKYECGPLDDRDLTRASPDPTPSAGSYGMQTTGHDYLSYPEHYWPVTGRYAQSSRPGIVSRDDSFASTVTLSEAPTVIPSPSSSKCFLLVGASKNRVLTNREQSRSTAGEPMRAAHPPPRSTR